MVDPGSFSCGSNRYQLNGNWKIINEIEYMTKKLIGDQISLYDAQENLKQLMCLKYGEDWYNKSAEAVQYIIEDQYASQERSKKYEGCLW